MAAANEESRAHGEIAGDAGVPALERGRGGNGRDWVGAAGAAGFGVPVVTQAKR
jgi:hypothetical protein